MINSICISIVVPVYNVENYLKKCIESIIGQSYKNLEIILVDDGSTDSCPEICDLYSRTDDRVKVIHKKNGGLVSARKAGTVSATGDYILNVDGDDWIESDRVEVLVTKCIMSARPDMVYMSGHKKDFGDDSIYINSDIPLKTFYGDEIRKQVCPLLFDSNEIFRAKVVDAMWAWAIKRELLQENQRLIDDRIVSGEDIICCWFCLLNAKSVVCMKQDGYHYIQRKSSLSYTAVSSSGSNISNMNIWYHQFRDFLEYHKVSEEIKKIFAGLAIRTIMQTEYELLLEKNNDYLYPFSKIKKGDKIIVYGAGKIGYNLMRYLSKKDDYQVMLWVDRNEKRYVLPGYQISTIEDIARCDYDYIIIAVQNADLTGEIRETLVNKGILEEKIAVMDARAIAEEAIPDEIKR